MKTHSAIILKQGTSVRGIYCHFDGMEAGVGRMLSNYYTDEKVEELIKLGDLSSLGDSVETSVSYHRDRGEDLNITRGASIFDVQKVIDHSGYIYVFEDGKWTLNSFEI